ncbi:uncharacterized protein LOC135618354 [Musa acuminata AAA Group]|uniref:uncharacterized protein LOC135618354 n=1 Tax=Musa acuminata AAA Group TaxID=214697 RepID=UPI0031CDF6EB
MVLNFGKLLVAVAFSSLPLAGDDIASEEKLLDLYCDFPIIALGSSMPHRPDTDPRISNYVQLLLREIAATRAWSDDCSPLETVFFGGGTPSLVPPGFVSSILDALKSRFGMCDSPEVSIEMDPGTFDKEKMERLLELGVNRVSLGVQAFQEELLRACGRAYGLKDVYEAIEIVADCSELQNWAWTSSRPCPISPKKCGKRACAVPSVLVLRMSPFTTCRLSKAPSLVICKQILL